MMMESHRNLDQTLQKFLLLSRCGAPHIFQYFMSFEELSSIEQLNPTS